MTENGRGGFTLWFTGLSGSGKTTIAELVRPELERRGLLVEWLDGGEGREHPSKGPGLSKGDRDTNIDRIGWGARRPAARTERPAARSCRESRDVDSHSS